LEFIDEFEYDFWFVLFTYPPVIATRWRRNKITHKMRKKHAKPDKKLGT
jgi:hypothetical protein